MKQRSNKISVTEVKSVRPRKTTGYIWVGMYNGPEGDLGWQLSPYVTPNGSEPLSRLQENILERIDEGIEYYPNDFYRAKIVLTPVKAKNGRYVVRRNKESK